MAQTEKNSRLEARINPQVHAVLKRAAEIEGRTLTDFVVAAALGAARETIERTDVLYLSEESAHAVVNLLENSPPVAPAMERAAERHKNLTRSS